MPLLSLGEALNLIEAHALNLKPQTIPLEKALGRRLAAPVKANVDRPFANLSAMDGYAVRLADVQKSGVSLNVVAEIPAGSVPRIDLETGQAARVFTGTPLPNYADHIVIQEDAMRDGNRVMIKNAYTRREYVRHLGQDFSKGETLLAENHILSAEDLSLIAAANHDMVTVWSRPKVAVLANGVELRPPGSSLGIGEIPNATPFGLIPLLESFGAEVTNLGVAGDDKASISAKIKNVGAFDIFVPCGGASVGKHDMMHPAFEAAGFDIVFSKIAVRPGKPSWFGVRGEQRVVGLPGNPTSTLVCARLLLGPLLGQDWQARMVSAKLKTPMPSEKGRDHFLRGHVETNEAGVLHVKAAKDQDSGSLLPWVKSNALILRPAHAPPANVGDVVRLIPLRFEV